MVQGLSTLLQGKLTVLVCFNVIRQYMPPLIVYSGKRRRNLDLLEEAYHEVLPNGWMTAEVFWSSCIICLICLPKRFLYPFCCMPLHTVPVDNRVPLQAKEIMFNDECQTLCPYNVPVDKTGDDKIEITKLYRNKLRYSHSGET